MRFITKTEQVDAIDAFGVDAVPKDAEPEVARAFVPAEQAVVE